MRKGFGDRLLVEDLTFSLPAGGIVGVIGPNGAGKTTLFRMIAGEEQPDGGELRVGETVELAYVDQSRAGLDPASTVWKEISGGHDTIELGKREVNSRQYVSWFNFKGADQQKRVSDLSGGERNRVHLAKLLRSGGNVLLLDEPTNDLDVDTLRALEEALARLRRLRGGDLARPLVPRPRSRPTSSHFEGDSQTTWFEGAYAEYAEGGCRRRAAPRRSSRTASSTSRSCGRSAAERAGCAGTTTSRSASSRSPGTAFALQQTMIFPACRPSRREIETTTTWVTWVAARASCLQVAVTTPVLAGSATSTTRSACCSCGPLPDHRRLRRRRAAWKHLVAIGFRMLAGDRARLRLSFAIIRDEFPPERVNVGSGSCRPCSASAVRSGSCLLEYRRPTLLGRWRSAHLRHARGSIPASRIREYVLAHRRTSIAVKPPLARRRGDPGARLTPPAGRLARCADVLSTLAAGACRLHSLPERHGDRGRVSASATCWSGGRRMRTGRLGDRGAAGRQRGQGRHPLSLSSRAVDDVRAAVADGRFALRRRRRAARGSRAGPRPDAGTEPSAPSRAATT